MVPILVPSLGIRPDQKILVSTWLVRPGEDVFEGDRVVELLMDEIVFDVPSPVSGKLARIAVDVDEKVCEGTVLGSITPDT